MCGHMFHKDCIDIWFETNSVCALCKRDFASVDQLELHDIDKNEQSNPDIEDTIPEIKTSTNLDDSTSISVRNTWMTPTFIQDEFPIENEPNTPSPDTSESPPLNPFAGSERFPARK